MNETNPTTEILLGDPDCPRCHGEGVDSTANADYWAAADNAVDAFRTDGIRFGGSVGAEPPVMPCDCVVDCKWCGNDVTHDVGIVIGELGNDGDDRVGFCRVTCLGHWLTETQMSDYARNKWAGRLRTWVIEHDSHDADTKEHVADWAKSMWWRSGVSARVRVTS